MNIHEPTRLFEKQLAKYLGSPYVIATDNMSNALWLCMIWENVKGKTIHLPKHTYPSVPCECILAGAKVEFYDSPKLLKGAYRLNPFPIWDSALSFTKDLYKGKEGEFVCVSFTGAYKRLKLGKGGAILCDNLDAYNWFKRAINSGRGECSYHEDTFTFVSRNCYMHPSIATLGIQLMQQFYTLEGERKEFEDIELPYPDLSLHVAYK